MTTEQAQEGASVRDIATLIAAVAIVIGGIVGFYYLAEWPIWGRWLLVLAAMTAGIFIAVQSQPGQVFWQFVQGSRVELRKVVWRDRDAPPTYQVALLVFVVVAILTTFFWVLDMGLGWLTRSLTGQGA